MSDSIICTFDRESNVGIVEIYNPRYSNAVSLSLLRGLSQGLVSLVEQGARCVVVHGIRSRNFCSGLDVRELQRSLDMYHDETDGHEVCPARLRMRMRKYIDSLQECVNSMERVPVPVIAAIHGHCVGAGVDLITACDIRLCTECARFCVKEVDLGISADMGTLSRLPGIVGDGVSRDMCLTASSISGKRAYEINLVTTVCHSQDELLGEALDMARKLAGKSPVALAGTKECLLYQRDHGNVQDSLTYVAMMNSALLPGNTDVQKIMQASKRGSGRGPGVTFSKL